MNKRKEPVQQKRHPNAFFLPAWAAERVTADKAQEIVTKTREMTHRSVGCSMYVNRAKRKYFFTTGHIYMHADFVCRRGYVAETSTIPHNVVPRKGLEDGWVDTVQKLLHVYYKDMTEIDPAVEWPELAADEVEA